MIYTIALLLSCLAFLAYFARLLSKYKLYVDFKNRPTLTVLYGIACVVILLYAIFFGWLFLSAIM